MLVWFEKTEVSIPYSKLKHAIADKLVQAGFITSATKYGKKVKKTLDITLKYDAQGAHVIAGSEACLKARSTIIPQCCRNFPCEVRKGKRILSTPAGILTGEEAKRERMLVEKNYSSFGNKLI
jgi:small subunit ribosomal protein S8